MYATIRRYPHPAGAPDELLRACRQLAAALSRAPGFVAYVLLEAGDGGLAAAGIFESRADWAAAEGLLARWEAEQGAALLPRPPRITGGEVVVQRGL
jgi:heme-degrading monooxygenase HmoA